MYGEHVPLFVTADSILFAIHRSYDELLAAIENLVLIDELRSVLSSSRTALKSCPVAQVDSCADVDLLLSVGLALLDGSDVAPVGFVDAPLATSWLEKCRAANASQSLELFGRPRLFDFSQLKPRGHYVKGPQLQQYFQAMMWLGRTDFRMVETQSNGEAAFWRRQFDDAVLIESLVDRKPYRRIDDTVGAFVGEHDSATLDDIARLLQSLGVTSFEQSTQVSSEQIQVALLQGGYGTQRIASQLIINGVGGTLPLDRSFTLFGQRYVVDSHVFSNLVYDRVGGGGVKRMLPDPLDVAFAVLNGTQAAPLLRPQLEQYSYAPDLAAMRLLVDGHPPEFWQASLYNGWLTALRGLALPKAPTDALPRTFQTEAWGKRLLNTQLASWAELRHDTMLYAKQSYSAGVICEFPDAYVDPYPQFYAAVEAYGTRGLELLQKLQLTDLDVWQHAATHFEALRSAASMLRSMAEHELTGEPFTAEMMAFINETVVVQAAGCGGGPTIQGWYPRLFFDGVTGGATTRLDGGEHATTEPQFTIADVHTRTPDDSGPGQVLHVATWFPRAMTVIVDSCSGPRAYVGPVSSYREVIAEGLTRFNDEEWSSQGSAAPDVPWMTDNVR
ncbi:MAG: DUF3160 domain-containing protein [Polyangiaceae bacterium]